MKKWISISLIAVYSIVFLHNVIPHIHLSSEVAHFEMEEHDHHNSNGHHHHHKQDISLLDSLLDLIGHHSHENTSENQLDEYLSNDSSNNLKINENGLNKLMVAHLIVIDKLNEDVQLSLFSRPPILYELINSSSDPLRGPPSKA